MVIVAHTGFCFRVLINAVTQSSDLGVACPSFLSLLPNTGCQGDPTPQMIIIYDKVQGSP